MIWGNQLTPAMTLQPPKVCVVSSLEPSQKQKVQNKMLRGVMKLASWGMKRKWSGTIRHIKYMQNVHKPSQPVERERKLQVEVRWFLSRVLKYMQYV